jgi:hypothetical protein
MSHRKPPHREVGPHPVTGQLVPDMTSVELQTQLVVDAVTGYATDLAWFVAALDRMAERDRITVDDAYQRVRAEVAELAGFMPGAPGS